MVKQIKGGGVFDINTDYADDIFQKKFIIGIYLIIAVVSAIINIIVMIFASLKHYSSFVNTMLVVSSIFVIAFTILSFMLVTTNSKDQDTLVIYSSSLFFIFASGITTLIFSLIPNARLNGSFYVSTILETLLIGFIAFIFLYSTPSYWDSTAVMILSTCTLILTIITYMNNRYIKSSDKESKKPSTTYV